MKQLYFSLLLLSITSYSWCSEKSEKKLSRSEYRKAKLALLERQCAGQERANIINQLYLAAVIATVEPEKLEAKPLPFDIQDFNKADVSELQGRARNALRTLGLPLFYAIEPGTAEMAHAMRTKKLEEIKKG